MTRGTAEHSKTGYGRWNLKTKGTTAVQIHDVLCCSKRNARYTQSTRVIIEKLHCTGRELRKREWLNNTRWKWTTTIRNKTNIGNKYNNSTNAYRTGNAQMWTHRGFCFLREHERSTLFKMIRETTVGANVHTTIEWPSPSSVGRPCGARRTYAEERYRGGGADGGRGVCVCIAYMYRGVTTVAVPMEGLRRRFSDNRTAVSVVRSTFHC